MDASIEIAADSYLLISEEGEYIQDLFAIQEVVAIHPNVTGLWCLWCCSIAVFVIFAIFEVLANLLGYGTGRTCSELAI